MKDWVELGPTIFTSKNLEALIVGAVMACYNIYIYEIRIGKGGDHSWVYRGTLDHVVSHKHSLIMEITNHYPVT